MRAFLGDGAIIHDNDGVPLIVLLDNVMFGWTAERFFSGTTVAILGKLPSLIPHTPLSTWLVAGIMLIFVVGFALAAFYLSNLIAKSAMLLRRRPSSHGLVATMAFLCCLISIPSVWQIKTTLREMRAGSQHHPLCALRAIAHKKVSERRKVIAPMDAGSAAKMKRLLDERVAEQDRISIVDQSGGLPDIVFVVVESFRPELVDAEIMPGLSKLAKNGVHCRQHFSSGNATTHGLFSLLNGLDAVWYSRRQHKPSILSRLLGDAGYEVGFFGGHNDWPRFYMDGFINPTQFDTYFDTRPKAMASDRRVITKAISFLHQSSKTRRSRPPRMAIVYLYATHATYHSYADDQIFQPAARDGFVIPFAKKDVPFVWNRYKNSARSLDGLLDAIVDPNRITIVTGDHGESFLEDGVCGHGIRISQFQNMTPAIISGPGLQPRAIDAPTSHADILPTILNAAGIQISGAELLDGLPLNVASHRALQNRIVATRNYLSDDFALIDRSPNHERPEHVFGYRASISLEEWRFVSKNPIDARGNALNEMKAGRPDGEKRLNAWIKDRFGIAIDPAKTNAADLD